MKAEQGVHQPRNWGTDPARVERDDSPGVHQIRLHATDGANHTDPRHHRHYFTNRSALEVACSCGAHLAWINPGDDCWTPFNEHLETLK